MPRLLAIGLSCLLLASHGLSAQGMPSPTEIDAEARRLMAEEAWRSLTARHVLTHSTGFANFRWLEDDRKLRFHFEPGEHYAYSGEAGGGFQAQVPFARMQRSIRGS